VSNIAHSSRPDKWGQRNLNTLQDAQIFIERLSTSPGPVPAWREAHELLKQAAEHGGLWSDLARINVHGDHMDKSSSIRERLDLKMQTIA
jgi:hypothetical protein